jgi:hypothetical protein
MLAASRTVAAAALLFVLPIPLGQAHEAASGWSYPWECCSATDCWEVGTGGPEPDPVPSPGGWKLADGTVVPFHLARASPDGRFHLCRKGGQPTGAVIRPHERPACLWVPAGG